MDGELERQTQWEQAKSVLRFLQPRLAHAFGAWSLVEMGFGAGLVHPCAPLLQCRAGMCQPPAQGKATGAAGRLEPPRAAEPSLGTDFVLGKHPEMTKMKNEVPMCCRKALHSVTKPRGSLPPGGTAALEALLLPFSISISNSGALYGAVQLQLIQQMMASTRG